MNVCDFACQCIPDLKPLISVNPRYGCHSRRQPKQHRRAFQFIAACIAGVVLAALVSIPARAQLSQDLIQTGHSPVAVAVNPITDTVFVANQGTTGVANYKCESDSTGYSVTVIHGATDRTQTVPVGFCPKAIAVNPIANKIYVAQGYAANSAVTIIDGQTLATTEVPVGGMLRAIAVNPVTNTAYVVSQFDDKVWAIDGTTNATTQIQVGTNPANIAINSVTNKIYVVDVGNLFNSANLAVIDGNTNQVSYVNVGGSPQGVAVNPVTNEIYVSYNKGLEIIDGNTNETKTASLGFDTPGTVRVNPVTGTIYVLDYSHNQVYAVQWPSIDTTPTSQTIAVAGQPTALAIDPVANQIYVSNDFAGRVSVLDGATNQVTNILLNNSPGASDNDVAVNPRTGKAYVVDGSSNNAVVLGATSPSDTQVATGQEPDSVAVDPSTNRAYTANGVGNSVTAIDGTSDQSIATIPTGFLPFSIAVNPLTSKVYTADSNSFTVTAIDENTLTSTTIPTLYPSSSLMVDPLTDTVYVGLLSNQLFAISGSNNATQTLGPTGSRPHWIVTNPDTGQIYILNQGSNTVTVYDGPGGTPTKVPVGGNPVAAAVDVETNNVYVANRDDGTVTLIGGPSNSTGTLTVGANPDSVAVNQVTNTIYVANYGSNSVTVINGLDNSTTATVGVGTGPSFVAVNPALNQVYVANYDSNNVTVIDGRTNTVLETLRAGTQPKWLAVNLATNKVYTANRNSDNVSIILEEQHRTIPLVATINPLTNNISSTSTPSFTFKVTSTFSPTATVPDAVFFQMDTIKGPWKLATATGAGVFKGTVGSALAGGVHTLYAYATDGQAASQRNSPLISNIAAYTFAVPATGGAWSGGPPNFTLTSANPSISVSPGQSATDTLTVASLNGFNQAVAFACTGLPPGVRCSFAPARVTPNGGAAATTTMTITTTGTGMGDEKKSLMSWPFAGGSITMAFAFFFFGRRRRLPKLLGVVLLLSLGGLMLGCGGQTTLVNIWTPPGNFIVTVTATSGSGAEVVTKAVNVALSVP